MQKRSIVNKLVLVEFETLRLQVSKPQHRTALPSSTDDAIEGPSPFRSRRLLKTASVGTRRYTDGSQLPQGSSEAMHDHIYRTRRQLCPLRTPTESRPVHTLLHELIEYPPGGTDIHSLYCIHNHTILFEHSLHIYHGDVLLIRVGTWGLASQRLYLRARDSIRN